MNKLRRKLLDDLVVKVEELKCDIELIRDEEQKYYDNMPESLQRSERATAAENAVSSMDDAIDNLENVIGLITEAAE